MALEDELKARTLALVSQQMANWVVEIQKRIVEHQANLVGALDELQENVARYDEKIDEGAISNAIEEVIAANPVAPPEPVAVAAPAPVATEAGPGIAVLVSAMTEVDTGANLTEVLTSLVNESAKQVDRVAMFIIKGTNAVGWYAKGFEVNEAVKQIQIPLASETIFKTVHTDRAPVLFDPATVGQTAQALQRMGGLGSSALAAPMVLRDKLAAVLYCDTTGPMTDPQAAFIDALVRFAAKTTDLLSFVPRTPGARPAAPVVTPGSSSAPRAMAPPPAPEGGGTVMFTPAQVASMQQTATAPPPAPAPPPPTGAPAKDGAGTVMFTASQMDQMRQQMSQMKPAAAPAAPALSPEETKAHEDAKRFARLIVSEIKLYNEAKVTEGRKAKDLHSRLKEDIERGRQMYHDRISPGLRNNTNYFHDELVRLLAGGDASALGSM
jgi:hypothetical protein